MNIINTYKRHRRLRVINYSSIRRAYVYAFVFRGSMSERTVHRSIKLYGTSLTLLRDNPRSCDRSKASRSAYGLM